MTFNSGERSEELAALVRLVADRAADTRNQRPRICLLLGAGADISSGGLSFAALKREAVEAFSGRAIFDVTLQERLDARFDELFAELPPDDRARLIETLFRRMQTLTPSDAYKLLVLLAEVGGVDAVVTTNFDVMLEHAEQALGRDLFQVFAPGLARPYLLTRDRFELPKKPYLKLHGDIASRSVVLLTSAELEGGQYDASMLDLLRSILRTHDLIIAGYSGYDGALASIINEAVEGTPTRIFWCNPRRPSPDAPLYKRIGGRARFIPVAFDHLLMDLARPLLERPSLSPTEPTYLRCLFEWRVEYCNREYIHYYGERAGKSMVDLFARRPAIEERLARFLLPNHPLAIITGPSGFGKTTIGIRLQKLWQADPTTRVMLIRARALPPNGDIEQYLAEQLGGLGPHAPFSLFRLERWLAGNGMRLLLFVDGINEFSPELGRCVQALRNLLRFCYFLPEPDGALRVIATVRQETWQSMLPHLDLAQLRQCLWIEEGGGQSLTTIACSEFSEEELRDAASRIREAGVASIDLGQLSQSAARLLRDPYLFGMLAEAASAGIPPVPGAALYARAFEAKLQRRGSLLDSATLKDILASVALTCLSTQQDRFREIDVQPPALRAEVLRLAKDLHVFIEAGDGFLQFDHDRTLEYFLAVSLASGRGPRLETLHDLRDFLKHFKGESKAMAAARLYFQLAPEHRFGLIADALRLLDGGDDRFAPVERELLFGFGREVLIEMAEHGSGLSEQYLDDAIAAAERSRIGEQHLRTVVFASATLPTDRAVPLLSKVVHAASDLAVTEANIYATDKLVKTYLMSGCPEIDLLREAPYADFFADPSLAPWQRLGRLLGLVSQLGPDNTHPEEYRSIGRVLDRAFAATLALSWDAADGQTVIRFFLANCDRLLFNATPHGIARFFGNPNRSRFSDLLAHFAAGGVIGDDEFSMLEPYTQTLSADIEYHLVHLLFILSSLNDLDATLQFAESRFAQFNNNTSPEEIDFFQAVLVYLHILHNLAYDVDRFAWWEEIVLREWPAILLYRPGLERGERRGFQDAFDRFFEDGFGVIYPYGILLPSAERRRYRFAEYQRIDPGAHANRLPMYVRYLREFLTVGRVEEALQLLQALSGVIVVWPTEGLWALREVIGHSEPRIRRATVRILAEAYSRHPEETLRFFQESGAAVSDEDLLEIKVRQDARIGRRQIEEEEWARMGHFLLRRPGSREVFISCLRSLVAADSFEDAALKIFQALGLGVAGR